MGCQCSHNTILNPSADIYNTQTSFSSKTLLLGETKVGKTSVANRFCSNRYSDEYTVTIGGTYLQKLCTLASYELTYHIWDCCGDERFASLLPIIWKDANAVIFVYDVSSPESFEKVNYWRKSLLELIPCGKIAQGLIGNKNDLDNKNVDCSKAKKFAEDHDMLFSEMSAKNGEGIEYFFYGFAEKILKQLKLKI